MSRVLPQPEVLNDAVLEMLDIAFRDSRVAVAALEAIADREKQLNADLNRMARLALSNPDKRAVALQLEGRLLEVLRFKEIVLRWTQ